MSTTETPVIVNGYILRLEKGREYILDEERPSEAVNEFAHNRKAPLVLFISTNGVSITHIADGKKGRQAATGKIRLNILEVEVLENPIGFDELISNMSPRLKRFLEERLHIGGLLPPKTLSNTVEAILRLDESLKSRLYRFTDAYQDKINKIPNAGKANLAEQRESLIAVLKMAGLDPSSEIKWIPGSDASENTFLHGLEGVSTLEDEMIIADYDVFPGMKLVDKQINIATKTFEGNGQRLKVMMANRTVLERQTGSDLIYYNETSGSFFFVQYKVMNNESGGAAVYRPDLQLSKAVTLMDELNAMLLKIEDSQGLEDYRLNANPFFFKLCSRVNFNVDNFSLFPGRYLPLDYWKRLIVDEATNGPKGGRQVTYQNMGRNLTNTDFIRMVNTGWFGTRVLQSEFLKILIKKILEENRTITFAVQSGGDPPPPPDGQGLPIVSKNADIYSDYQDKKTEQQFLYLDGY